MEKSIELMYPNNRKFVYILQYAEWSNTYLSKWRSMYLLSTIKQNNITKIYEEQTKMIAFIRISQ